MFCAERITPDSLGRTIGRTIGVLALAVLVSAAHPAHAAAIGGRQVHWTLMGQNAVTFDWEGPDSVIAYGPTIYYGQTLTATTPSPVPFSSPGPFREARITGLSENKLYHYSIGGGPDHTFHTPPPRGSPTSFTVLVEGDIGDATTYPNVAAVQTLVAATSPAFVLMVGDLTYGDDNGQAAVDNHFNDMMAWSQDAAYMPAWGNHEGDPGTDDLRNYKGRFDLPNQQTSPGSPAVACCGEDWYWFDYGNVRFIAYPEPWTGALAAWNATAASIMDAAQADPAIRFIITFGHRPAYSSGHHSGLVSLKGYLDALGAGHSKYVLNLDGHSHDYERSYQQKGVVHVTVGTGGSSLEQDGSCLWLTCTQPSWSAFRAYHLGPLRLRFTSSGIQGVFLCGPAGGGTNDVECALGNAVDSFFVNETRLDSAPVVAAPRSIEPIAGTPVSVVVTASDPNGEALTSLMADLSALPAGNNAVFTAGVGNTSGTLTWTPAAGDARPKTPYGVSFTASNALSGTSISAITVLAGLPPSAALSLTPATGNSPLNVTADASGSTDSDGSVASYVFDFGDGTIVGPQAGTTATHAYAPGRWTASVVVTDNSGQADTATASVFAANPPPGTSLTGNPSFETSTGGWSGVGATMQRVAGGFDGAFSLEMTGPATGTAKFGINDVPNTVALVPAAGTVYRFAAWVRSAAGTGKAQLRIREFFAGVQQGVSVFSPDVPLTSAWKKTAVDYVALTTSSTIDFNVLYAPVAPGEAFQADNVSVYQDYVVSGAPVGEDGTGLSFAAVMSPNPVRPDGLFFVTTSRAGFVRARLYDVTGRMVQKLLEAPSVPRGRHAVRFDGRDASGRPLPSGIYFYRVEAAEGVVRGRFIVLR